MIISSDNLYNFASALGGFYKFALLQRKVLTIINNICGNLSTHLNYKGIWQQNVY